MESHLKSFILQKTEAEEIIKVETIQSLWSGYGEIFRCFLSGGTHDSIVVKHVKMPVQNDHPRGWNTNLSHERKVKSYQVETFWYTHYESAHARIPKCYGVSQLDNEVIILLEDLDKSGFSKRVHQPSFDEILLCIRWLAQFHAQYVHQIPTGLWDIGTYWHLDTRPEELEVLTDLVLKNNAEKIDDILNQCTYKTLVHGDAKLANFCFSPHSKEVAAVDFQYIGGGCGMKDLAYFIGSCLSEKDCEKHEKELLDIYFECFKSGKMLNKQQSEAIEEEWRRLFPVAWTDFHRFLKGWSPGHWKINTYSEKLAQQVIQSLK